MGFACKCKPDGAWLGAHGANSGLSAESSVLMLLDALGHSFLYCAMFRLMRLIRLPVVMIVAGLLWAAVLTAGCSSKENRYPEDHARFAKVDKVVEELRAAYSRRDLGDVQDLMLPREVLEKAANDMQQDFQTYQEIALEWTIDRIVIEGEGIEVVVNWAGQWRKNPADTGTRERGQGILKLAGEKTVLLNGLEGDLPFGMALRRAGEATPASRPR